MCVVYILCMCVRQLRVSKGHTRSRCMQYIYNIYCTRVSFIIHHESKIPSMHARLNVKQYSLYALAMALQIFLVASPSQTIPIPTLFDCIALSAVQCALIMGGSMGQSQRHCFSTRVTSYFSYCQLGQERFRCIYM